MFNTIALNKINDTVLNNRGIELFIKRDDTVHLQYGGNKFRKLKYNLEFARQKNYDTLITFGGAFSNHIAATAYAGKQFNFKTIGIIRGEELKNAELSKTLQQAKANGMQLEFVSRSDYNRKFDADYLNELSAKFNNPYIIAEGGCNHLGMMGCSEILSEIDVEFDYVICPVGTGTTFLGIASALKPHQQALGIEVYKNNSSGITSLTYARNFPEDTSRLIAGKSIEIFNYSFNGFGKSTPELDAFCKSFSHKNDIPVEPVYTGKMFYGIYDLSAKGYFKNPSRIVAIHTGGLQYL